MARRREFSVEDVPLVGGALILDFINTTGARSHGTPRERLHSYRDLLIWAKRVGILDEPEAADLRGAAGARPSDAAAAFRRALVLREGAYKALAPLALDVEPSHGALSGLDRWVARAYQNRRLTMRDGELVWTWDIASDQLESVVWPIIASVDSVVATGVEKLKKCGECDWLFLDTSRKGNREWCKKLCGDRVRARRHYQRVSETDSEEE